MFQAPPLSARNRTLGSQSVQLADYNRVASHSPSRPSYRVHSQNVGQHRLLPRPSSSPLAPTLRLPGKNVSIRNSWSVTTPPIARHLHTTASLANWRIGELVSWRLPNRRGVGGLV